METVKEKIETFEDLVVKASLCLSEEDKKWLAENRSYDVAKDLENIFEELRMQIPAMLMPAKGQGLFLIPAVGESAVDPEAKTKSRPFVNRDEFLGMNSDEDFKLGMLYPSYPSQGSTTLTPKTLSKSLDWGGFTRSLGDLTKLREHTITPKQFELLIPQIRERKKGEQLEYIVFMEGWNKSISLLSKGEENFKAIHILRIFVGEMNELDFNKTERRHLDWRFLGDIFPLEILSDGHPAMRASACWFDRPFDEDSVILFKEKVTA